MLQLLPTLRSNLLRPIFKDTPQIFLVMALPHQVPSIKGSEAIVGCKGSGG